MSNNNTHNIITKPKGFSLVELSVVLVIISLIIGSIVAGGAIIRNAEVKTIIADVNELKAAIGQFEEIYRGKPGDMSNASSYFNGADNGDGDGEISYEENADASKRNEAFDALLHLQNAELIVAEGNFTGSWNNAFAAGDNVMEGKSKKGTVLYVRCCGDNSLAFKNHVNVFKIASGSTKRTGAFTAVEAFSIDNKMDDGNPDTGFIGANGQWVTSAYTAAGCYTGTGSSAAYATTDNNTTDCQMLFAYDWD